MNNTEKEIWEILKQVNDPEIPVLSVVDLGIIREVKLNNEEGRQVDIVITPTYSGCPAMKQIESDIRSELAKKGFPDIHITSVLSPAWTTDWMSETGRQKLKAYGIAPPNPSQSVCSIDLFQHQEAIQCPQCNSYHTRLISQFGSTACKALYQCHDCKETFDYFKCH